MCQQHYGGMSANDRSSPEAAVDMGSPRFAYHLCCRLTSSWRVCRLTGQPRRAALPDGVIEYLTV
jgi:hypothetical protein